MSLTEKFVSERKQAFSRWFELSADVNQDFCEAERG